MLLCLIQPLKNRSLERFVIWSFIMRRGNTFFSKLSADFFTGCFYICLNLFGWKCVDFINNVQNKTFGGFIIDLEGMLDCFLFLNRILTIQHNGSRGISHTSTITLPLLFRG